MNRIIGYVFQDLIRTRFIALYSILLLMSTFALFQIDSDPSKVVMSLLNIVLIVVPLISIVFTTIHFYNSYEFIELMLAQPVNRRVVFLSEYLAVASSLVVAFLAGCGIPVLLFTTSAAAISLLFCGTILTMVFVSLAVLSSVLTRDKARAIGLALLFWFYFSLIYDGFLLWVVYAFSDYPLERATLVLIALNPVDLARVIMLLQLDISALMGYTGAFYQDFFGGSLGTFVAVAALALWILLPVVAAMRIFDKKDL